MDGGRARDAPPAAAATEAAAPPPAPAETLAEPPRRRAGAAKRKAASSLSSAPPPKRLLKERTALNLLPSLHNGPCTRARQSPNKLAAAASAAAAPAQKPPEASPAAAAATTAGGNDGVDGADQIGGGEEELVEQPPVDLEFEAIRSRGADAHVVPTPAGWFSWTEIHPVEKHSLASFFNGKSESRTPEIYLEIRNFIMKKFHANPQTQLELKDLEELSVGDSEAKQEVMGFLDHWGLINFHPFPPSVPDVSVSDAVEDKSSSSLLEKLYVFEAVQSCPRLVPKKVELSPPVMLPHLLPDVTITDELVKPVEPSVEYLEYHCNSCSADCSRKRYHCQKQADFDLCSECYNNGNFGSGMASSDFILMEPAEAPGVSGGSWTDQETLLLLEALELFGENWNEITEHVATKTKAQCILHFLQMPIEDPFLEGNDDADDNIKEPLDSGSANKETTSPHVPETEQMENTGAIEKPVSSPPDAWKAKDSTVEAGCETDANIAIDALKAAFEAIGCLPEQEGSVSFAEAGNPVMALAAFLVGLVDTNVATTSSWSSLKAMSEEFPGIQLATRHCFLLEDPPDDKKEDSPNDKREDSPSDEKEDSLNDNKVDLLNDKREDPPNDKKEDPPTDKKEDMPTDKIENPSNDNKEDPPNDGKDQRACESAVLDMGSKDAMEREDKMMVPNGADETKECIGKNKEYEKKHSDSLQECFQKIPVADESDDSVLPSGATPSSAKDSADLSLTEERILPSAGKDGSDSPLPMVLTSSNSDGPGDSALQGEAAAITSNEMNDSKLEGEDNPNPKVSKNLSSADHVEQMSDSSNAGDTGPASAPLEEKEPQQKQGTGLTVAKTDTTDVDEKKDPPSNDEKSCNLMEIDDAHRMNRLKRAAVTALSASAVKAKLLASQEEDHIRQLVSLVIEKQLQKLEMKLGFFAEIESVIMRMREQTDRARQRLIHERAQIIAARLGLQAPSSRANLGSLATNKVAMAYGTAGPRPPNMAFQKPPSLRRP